MAEKITPKELQARKDEYVIIDVREADELKEGQIDGAISLPLGRLIREARHGDLDEIKRKKIYTYCSRWIQRKYRCRRVKQAGI